MRRYKVTVALGVAIMGVSSLMTFYAFFHWQPQARQKNVKKLLFSELKNDGIIKTNVAAAKGEEIAPWLYSLFRRRRLLLL